MMSGEAGGGMAPALSPAYLLPFVHLLLFYACSNSQDVFSSLDSTLGLSLIRLFTWYTVYYTLASSMYLIGLLFSLLSIRQHLVTTLIH